MPGSGRARAAAALLLLALLAVSPHAPAQARRAYTYVGLVGPHAVLLAWGTLGGPGNTIGRGSAPMGAATIRIAGRTLTSPRNWVVVGELAPDTSYAYEIEVDGRRIGGGEVRTHPVRARRLAFFVLGDWGNDSQAQYRLAEAMRRELEKRGNTPNPVRFVITTGDNLYADGFLGLKYHTGSRDRDWEAKFFRPYAELIRRIPFHASLGNHDGNASEARADLDAYLDNFFFPDNAPAHYYQWGFGGLVDFFALDSTENTSAGPPAPAYLPGGPQDTWLREALRASTAPWKIAYFHHAPFNAGPRHPAFSRELEHFVRLFSQAGVSVVFNGHEHNFQFTTRGEATGGVLYVVSGAGGELRRRDVRARMRAAHIAGWAPQNHFLLVEIEDRILRITPLGFESIVVRDPDGNVVPMPLEIRRP